MKHKAKAIAIKASDIGKEAVILTLVFMFVLFITGTIRVALGGNVCEGSKVCAEFEAGH